jgi:hypothetical protein
MELQSHLRREVVPRDNGLNVGCGHLAVCNGAELRARTAIADHEGVPVKKYARATSVCRCLYVNEAMEMVVVPWHTSIYAHIL